MAFLSRIVILVSLVNNNMDWGCFCDENNGFAVGGGVNISVFAADFLQI